MRRQMSLIECQIIQIKTEREREGVRDGKHKN